MKTTITGHFDGKKFGMTIDSPLDGKETAVFMADLYNALMVQAPSVLRTAEKHTPIIAKAMRKLDDAFKAVIESFK